MREKVAAGLLAIMAVTVPATAGGVPCPWDLDGDGEIGIVDFLDLLAAWGPNPGHPADFDNDGEVGITDFLELLANWGPCPVCGPGAGPCFASHAGPGCDDVACCTLVCNDDPFCCDVAWDGACAQAAFSLCENATGACCLPTGVCVESTADECAAAGGVFEGGGITCNGVICPDILGACCLTDGSCAELEPEACETAGGYFHGIPVDCADVQCSFPACPGTTNCVLAGTSPGCNDVDCCNFVCSVAPTCCEVAWDQSCADLALTICGDCGDPQAGSCFTDNGTPGCNEAECCATVCPTDPFCCLTLWDQLCVDGAANLCNQLDCGDPDRCQPGDLITAFMSNGPLYTEADNFVMEWPDDAPVNGVCWWGTYYSFENCTPAPDDFTINYYADADGLPGALLASFSQSGGTLAVAPPVATGSIINSGNAIEYEHTATHADLVLSPGVCYWIEIINLGPPDPCRWFWESSAVGDDVSAQTVASGPWEGTVRDFAFCLNVPLFGEPPCSCPLECPAGAIDEGEPCGSNINGGCNDDPPLFTPAACGDVFCGTAWAEGNFRDTDWYLVNHAGGGLGARVTSQFPAVLFIFDVNLDTCVYEVETTGCADDCASIIEVSKALAAGDYVIFVGTGNCSGSGIFDGVPCGSGNDYTLEIFCPPTGGCCLGFNCSGRTEDQCLADGGVYLGDGVSCPTTGACCLDSSTCVTTSSFQCIIQGGTFVGLCADCAEVDCTCALGLGACCLPNLSCQIMETATCFFSGGIFLGECTSCAGCP